MFIFFSENQFIINLIISLVETPQSLKAFGTLIIGFKQTFCIRSKFCVVDTKITILHQRQSGGRFYAAPLATLKPSINKSFPSTHALRFLFLK